MNLRRAFSQLSVKAVDEDQRIITGTASTPQVDRVGDVVESTGLRFNNPVSLLLYHDKTKPVGQVWFDPPTKAGVRFRAHLPKVLEPGIVKDRVDEAWHSLKYQLLGWTSIGFRPDDDAIEVIKTGLRFLKSELLELSLVTVAANQSASIDSVKAYCKSLDASSPAASGIEQASPPSAGVSAPRKARTGMQKTYGEQITDLSNRRVANEAAMAALQEKALNESRTKDEAEREEFKRLQSEIERFDDELQDLRVMERVSVQKATPAVGTDPAAASASRGGGFSSITVSGPKLPPGIGFARGVKARLVARLDGRNALHVAKEMYPSDDRLHAHLEHQMRLPQIIAQIKAAVPAATTTHSTWAGALMDPTNLDGEFIEFLRPATIIGRLNLHNIPTNVRVIEQTQGGTGYWVGQGAPKPLTAFGFAPITLSPTKVAAISVATEESLRFSTPSLDQRIRDGLRGALVERVDRDLLDPAEAGSANVQPASLTNGLTALTSSGTSADNIRTDIAVLIRTVRSANITGPIAVVLPSSLMTGMAWLVNALGQPEFPGLNNESGTINGIRFVASEYMANQSGAGNLVVAIAENEVFVSDDGGVQVDASREASLQMLDNPTNNSATATATSMVSMWQTNSVAFRGEWFINWQKRRAEAVAYMDDVNWGSVGSP